MSGIIGFKDITGDSTITLAHSGGVTASVTDGSLDNLRYRSLARSVTILAADSGFGGTAILRIFNTTTVRVAALVGVSGLESTAITSVDCKAYNGATVLETVTVTVKPELLDYARQSHVIPFVFSQDLTITRVEFVFTVTATYSPSISIGRAVVMRALELPLGFGRDWEIDHDDTTEVAYVGRYGSPSVLRGTTFRKITAPIPLANETLLFGDGLTTSFNQNLDDFVRTVGRGDDVLIVPRTSAAAGDLFRQRASILGLLDNPLPTFKHRAGRLWNTSITVRESR